MFCLFIKLLFFPIIIIPKIIIPSGNSFIDLCLKRLESAPFLGNSEKYAFFI